MSDPTNAAAELTDEAFIRRQLAAAEQGVQVCRASVAEAGVGMDHQWNLGRLVTAETEVRLYRRALTYGPEAAAMVALSLISAVLGGTSNADAFDNEIARRKASAAYEVIRLLGTAEQPATPSEQDGAVA